MKNENKQNKLSREAQLDVYFNHAIKDKEGSKHTRLEFIRKGKGDQPRQKIGVMVSCIDPMNPFKVIIGFSLCHAAFDEFDKIVWGVIKKKDHGKKIAHRRAMKWGDFNFYEVYSKKLEKKETGIVYIPATVDISLANFVYDSYNYYKDKTFPVWVESYLPRKDDEYMNDELEEEEDIHPSEEAM